MTKGPYKAVQDKKEVYVHGAKGMIIAFCENPEIPLSTQIENANVIADSLNKTRDLVRRFKRSKAYQRQQGGVIKVADVFTFLQEMEGLKAKPKALPPKYFSYVFGTRGDDVLGLHVTKTRVILTGTSVGLPSRMRRYISCFTFTTKRGEGEFDVWRADMHKEYGVSIPRAELLVDRNVRIPFNPPCTLRHER